MLNLMHESFLTLSLIFESGKYLHDAKCIEIESQCSWLLVLYIPHISQITTFTGHSSSVEAHAQSPELHVDCYSGVNHIL